MRDDVLMEVVVDGKKCRIWATYETMCEDKGRKLLRGWLKLNGERDPSRTCSRRVASDRANTKHSTKMRRNNDN